MYVGSTQRDVLWRGITKTVNFTVVYGAKRFLMPKTGIKKELQDRQCAGAQKQQSLCGENFNHYNKTSSSIIMKLLSSFLILLVSSSAKKYIAILYY